LARLTGGSLEAVFPIRRRANEDIAQHDSAARASGRLARTFPAQIEALNRYRSHGEPAITVQYVSVGDGGKAIVGNVTQHASVIVSDKKPAPAARKAPKAAGTKRRSRLNRQDDAGRAILALPSNTASKSCASPLTFTCSK
jgi:hypothetical protein